MTRDAFDDPRLTAMGLLIEVYVGLTDQMNLVHGRRGLTGTDFDTLIRLARSPQHRLRMSDLAAQTSRSTSGITRIVDRLERIDLVRRETCAGDRRSALAVLTDKGRQLLTAHVPAVTDAIEHCYTGLLTRHQLDALLVALHTIRRHVRPYAAAGAESAGKADRTTDPAVTAPASPSR